MTNDERYDRWANYETRCVHMGLSSDGVTYRYWREQARRHREEAPRCAQVERGVWTAEQAIRFNLADQLRDEVEHDGGCSSSSLYGDLLLAALSRVDWVEVAEAFLAESGPGEVAGPKFPLGQVVITPGVREALGPEVVQAALCRHEAGDWGELDAEDSDENEFALRGGFRLLSAYTAGETRFWVITEADRSATTVLLPDEY
jgi:hypothetical protein